MIHNRIEQMAWVSRREVFRSLQDEQGGGDARWANKLS